MILITFCKQCLWLWAVANQTEWHHSNNIFLSPGHVRSVCFYNSPAIWARALMMSSNTEPIKQNREKSYKQINESINFFFLNKYIKVTFSWNVDHRCVLSSVVTQHGLVNALIFSGELTRKKTNKKSALQFSDSQPLGCGTVVCHDRKIILFYLIDLKIFFFFNANFFFKWSSVMLLDIQTTDSLTQLPEGRAERRLRTGR